MKKIIGILFIVCFFTIPYAQLKAESINDRLKGRIILQVESHGEAYYVHPVSTKAYYMADGNAAYNVMRDLGLGITTKDLEKVKSNKTFAKKNSGKIFLQVESHGEAYYIDFNGIAHYLKDGVAAYEIMRNLGLGITNDNLNKISISETDKAISSIIEQPVIAFNKDNFTKEAVESKIIESTPPVCSSWIYSDWSICTGGQQTRTVLSSSPNGCFNGTPVLNQPCTPAALPCESDTWLCEDWNLCSTAGNQTRHCSKIFDCFSADTPSPAIIRNCAPTLLSCSSWTYSDWSICAGGQQTRSVLSSWPNGCSNGAPILTQSCTPTLLSCSSWTYSDWSVCQSNNTRIRSVLASFPSGCNYGEPILSQSCVYIPEQNIINLNFSSDKSAGRPGDTVTLNWSSKNADFCELSGGNLPYPRSNNGSVSVIITGNSVVDKYELACFNSFYSAGVRKKISINSIYDIDANHNSFICSGTCAPFSSASKPQEQLFGNFAISSRQFLESAKINQILFKGTMATFSSGSINFYLKDKDGTQISNLITINRNPGIDIIQNFNLDFNLNQTILSGETKTLYLYYYGVSDQSAPIYNPSAVKDIYVQLDNISAELTSSMIKAAVCIESYCK